MNTSGKGNSHNRAGSARRRRGGAGVPGSAPLGFEPLETRSMLSATPAAGTLLPTPSDSPAAAFSPALADDTSTAGSLPAPTISLPYTLFSISGSTPTEIGGVWISDPGSSQLTVTISAQHGTLSVADFGGTTPPAGSLDVLAAYGVTVAHEGTSSITLTGSEQGIFDVLALPSQLTIPGPNRNLPAADVANATSGLTYTADKGFTGTDTLTVTASGAAGSSTSPTASSQLLLDVVPQSMGPIIAAPSIVYTGGLPQLVVFNSSNNQEISISDPSAGTGTIEVSLSVDAGTLTLASTAGVSISSGANGTVAMTFTGTVADVDRALDGLEFSFPGASQGVDAEADTSYLEIDVNDLGHNSFDQPQTASTHVNIAAPNITAPTAQYISPGSSLVFSRANGNAVTISSDSASPLQLSAQNGTLTLGSTAGVQFTSGGNGQSSMTITGTTAALNNALNGLTYTPGPLPAGQTSAHDAISFQYDTLVPLVGLDNPVTNVTIEPNAAPPATYQPVSITTPAAQATAIGRTRHLLQC